MISDSSTSSDLFKSKSLLTDIFKYVDFKTNSKLIFLGDTAQLPPVKQTVSPALNSDLIKEFYGFKSMEFTLSNVVRQSESSGILINATTIRNNILNEIFSFDFQLYPDVEILNDGFEIQEKIESSYNENGSWKVCLFKIQTTIFIIITLIKSTSKWLSIPFIIIGIVLMLYSRRKYA